MTFSIYEEATDFKELLENQGFIVDLKLVRELYEIPETDENLYHRAEEFNEGVSDGNNSFNRQSPITPGDGRVLHSGRYH